MKASDLEQGAVVVLSVSHDLQAQGAADAMFYMDGGAHTSGTVMTSLRKSSWLPSGPESDFRTRYGGLYILHLKPGHHVIDSWQIYSAGVRYSSKAPPPPLEFDAKAGDVLYLGNLHARLMLGGRTLFGGRMALGGIPEVRDAQVEDIPVAEKQMPALKGKIKVALLRQGQWLASGDTGELKSIVEPLAVPPVPKK